MEEVFEFDKTKFERLLEVSSVLRPGELQIPTSSVRNEWANYVEVTIEPTGWQAVWRIPRLVCEDFSLIFPTVLHGTVEQVLFDELKARFVIDTTQEEALLLSEKHCVPLEELWPTKEQENDALNIEQTANCIDQLRFFYRHVWMPWDNDIDDNDINWMQKHVDARIQLYFAMENGTISSKLSSHVLSLISEANYIQRKRELLELEIESHEDVQPDRENTDAVTKLLQLHLRLNSIKGKVEIFENPTMCEIYEKIHFATENKEIAASADGNRSAADVFVITNIGTLDRQLQHLNAAKSLIDKHKIVHICDSLQEALNRCKRSCELYLSPAKHTIKFLEYLNSGGSMVGVSAVRFVQIFEKQMSFAKEEKVIIGSKYNDSILLTIDGDYCVENIMLDCSNVRTAVLIKGGNVTFRNCCLIGDSKSSTKQGVVVFGFSTIRFESCIIKGFSTGIYSNHQSEIHLVDTTISDCINGINALHGCHISFASSKIRNCRSYGTILEVDEYEDELYLTCNDYKTIDREEFKFRGNCEFNNNRKADFIIFNGKNANFNSSCFVDPLVRRDSLLSSSQYDSLSNRLKDMDY